MKPLIFDAHLDLSMNALQWNRDLTCSVSAIRRSEKETPALAGEPAKGRGCGTVALPDMRRGRVGICCATLLARVFRRKNPLFGFRSTDIAWAVAQGQLAFYRVLERKGVIRIIRDKAALGRTVSEWQKDAARARFGFIITMEGADPIHTPERVAAWWADGVRAVGLAHYGVGRYAHGTATPGGLRPGAKELLRAMEQVGMILDVTHLADRAMAQALDCFGGHVMASHHNCRALVPSDRQLADAQIRTLVARGVVIGAALDSWMLYPGWIRGKTKPSVVGLHAVADHIDHVCQLAGNARHSGIGSDLDGGFGKEQSPRDLETIADLQKIGGLLRRRGYSTEDIAGIMHGNWLRFFRTAWTRE